MGYTFNLHAWDPHPPLEAFVVSIGFDIPFPTYPIGDIRTADSPGIAQLQPFVT